MNKILFPKIIINKVDGRLHPEVVWPERLLPKSVVYQQEQYTAWGYEVDYDQVGFDKKVQMLISGEYESLALIDQDLLVILWNRETNDFKAFVSMSGFFPLYFGGTDKEKLCLSPDFYEVFKELGDRKVNKDAVLDYMLQADLMYQTDETFVSGINKLPSGCVLEIDSNLSWKIVEAVDLQKVLGEAGPQLSAKEAVEEIERVLAKQIKKRASLFRDRPIVCEMSSGFDCMLIAYLMRKDNIDFKGFSNFTSLNSDDSDPDIVKKWCEKYGVDCVFNDATETLYFQDDKDLQWNMTHFYPAWHSLSLALSDEQMKREVFGEYTLSFTGNGGDEFLHASDLVKYLGDVNGEEFAFIDGFAKDGGENIYTQEAYDRLTSKNRASATRFYGNRYGGSAGEQCYFPVLWANGTWNTNPYDTIEMLKLSQRLPKDEKGETIHKQKLYFGNTEAFIPEQYRVKLPMHEQVFRFLEERKEVMEKLLENSVLGELGIVKSQELLNALRQGKIKEVVKEHYLTFGNLCRLEVFLQANNVR